ncbi:TIR-like protein FxsC [Streptomyces hokutonensis]|uniref:TIR-like protein FxsC n=1 Tax=Streptomyces hokutonensis TaxID=1306990 RepID=UPI00368A1724
MIAALRAALAAAGYDPTPEELADILWLAARPHSGMLLGPAAPGTAAAGRAARPGADRARAGPQPAPLEQSGNRVLFASAGWSGPAGGVAVSPTRIPTPRALTNARGLARSLRPLRSTVCSHTHFQLDVAATVTALADGFHDIILTPAREPLLDLMFIVDDGISMAVWRDAAMELHQEFHRLKAFRRIRLLGMNSDDPDTVRFLAEPFRPTTPVTAPSSGARALLLVLTDAVGPAWQTGTAQEWLLRWAAKGSTAVFHVLPKDMWPSTGLPTVRLMASASRAGVTNPHIRLRHPRVSRDILPVPSPPIPVIDLVPGATTRSWARLVGAPSGEAALHFYDPEQRLADAPATPEDEEADGFAENALEDFLALCSDEAGRLASHLACAGSALTIPLMRLVQGSAVPTSGPEHLAEVFLSGMLIPYAPVTQDGLDPLPHEVLPWDQRAFAFPPAVADSLRELVRRSEERATHDYVTDYLAQRHRTAKAGQALISDPQGALRAHADLPLGSVGPDHAGHGRSRQISLTTLTEPLNGLMDRLNAPRLDWVHEAVATRAGTADAQRVADLLILASQASRADDAELFMELCQLLEELSHDLGRDEMATAYRRALADVERSASGPYFFLSYARAPTDESDVSDPNLWVHHLFRDLCEHVDSLTAYDGMPGFMDRSMSAGQLWSDELARSLSTCRVFVPLYSPRYFISRWCGQEWAAFASRRTRFREPEAGGRPSAIVPAVWSPVPAHRLPDVVKDIQYVTPHLGHRYREYGLYGLSKVRSFRSDYERAVLALAQRIVEVGESVVVAPGSLDSLSRAPDAFTGLGGHPRTPSSDLGRERFRLDASDRSERSDDEGF